MNMKNKIVYNYNKKSGEFIDQTFALPSPLEPGKWLIPANATDIPPPPTSTNEAPVFNSGNNTWNVVKDFRGERYWSTDGTEHEITLLGVVKPPNSLSRSPLPPLEEYKVHAADIIDREAGKTRASFISVGDMIEQEYKLAEKDASKYLADNSIVPDSLLVWSEITGKSLTDSANEIVDKASSLYTVLTLIRKERLLGKYAVSKATNHAGVDNAVSKAIAAIQLITSLTKGS